MHCKVAGTMANHNENRQKVETLCYMLCNDISVRIIDPGHWTGLKSAHTKGGISIWHIFLSPEISTNYLTKSYLYTLQLESQNVLKTLASNRARGVI